MIDKDTDNIFIMPEIQYGRRTGGHPSREDYYDYDNDIDINRLLPTAEYIESLNPEKQRKLKLAAEVLSICWSLAGDFVMSQDENILDDYNW